MLCFLTKHNCYNECFFKKHFNCRNNCGILLHAADLEHSLIKEKICVHIFFFPFLCSGFPDLALGILKMLFGVCFRDVVQPAVYNLFLASCDIQSVCIKNYSMYSKCLPYTSISYVQ